MAIWWKDVSETQATAAGPFVVSRINDPNGKGCSGAPQALSLLLQRCG